MSANIFKIEGKPISVNSFKDFMALEKSNKFLNILYMPECFNETPKKVIVIKGKLIKNVSFKDTSFENVRFIDCTFERCLLLSSIFSSCEFINCNFIKTNTLKSKFKDTLIDPCDFSENFDLKKDTNIAADLYHSLYKNLTNERQPDRAKQSLYLLYRAEYAHLTSQLERNKISKSTYYKKRIWHLFHNITSGYGLKLHRIFFTLLAVVLVFSIINFIFRDAFFGSEKIATFLDAIYFTLVTLTTLGYGDITPFTQIGRAVIMIQTIVGISVISLFLSSIASRNERA